MCFNDNNQASSANYKLVSSEAGKLVKKLLQWLSQQKAKLGKWPVEEWKELNSGQKGNAKNKIDVKDTKEVALMGSDAWWSVRVNMEEWKGDTDTINKK